MYPPPPNAPYRVRCVCICIKNLNKIIHYQWLSTEFYPRKIFHHLLFLLYINHALFDRVLLLQILFLYFFQPKIINIYFTFLFFFCPPFCFVDDVLNNFCTRHTISRQCNRRNDNLFIFFFLLFLFNKTKCVINFIIASYNDSNNIIILLVSTYFQ